MRPLEQIHIQLNGKPHQCKADATVAQLLQQLDLNGKRLAVELNAMIVPRSRFDQQTLNEHDKVEIVRAIGGG